MLKIKTREMKKKLSFSNIVAGLSLLIAALSLYLSIENQKLNKKTFNIANQTKVGNLTSEAWDLLGGEKNCNISFSLVKKNLVEAKRKIDEAEKCLPNGYELFLIKGLYSETEGNNSEACKFYAKAIEIDSTKSMVYLNMGNALFDQEKYQEAENSYIKALSIDKDNEVALYNLRVLYEFTNKPKGVKKVESTLNHIHEFRGIESKDSINDDTLSKTRNINKSLLGRSFYENAFKTEISHWKDSIIVKEFKFQ